MTKKNSDISMWRIGVAHGTFLRISLKHYNKYCLNIELLKTASDDSLVGDTGLTQYDLIEEELYENFTCIITFLALFMESYIYDYGARQLGDRYVLSHLDQLDLLSKWVIIPKIITGKEINKSQHCFEYFKRLIQLRNKIVHWKSSEGSHSKSREFATEKFYLKLNPEKLFKSIYKIFEQLEEYDKKDYHLFHVTDIKEAGIRG